MEEIASTVENQLQIQEPQTKTFKWTIGNFSRLNSNRHYSDVFTADGYQWRVRIFPKGGDTVDDHLSMYLDAVDSSTLRNGWSRCAEFTLTVVNQLHRENKVKKDTHQFNARESSSGFTSFMPLSELYDLRRGFLMNDTLLVEADVAVRSFVDYWTYDSKKETGYVGLTNQKVTWPMNAVLQILYHIPYLRKAVYDMPTTEKDMPTTENDMPSGRSLSLALRRLFYKLQYSDYSVSTKELTNSFDYPFVFNLPKFSNFLRRMLADKTEGAIQWLFEGHRQFYFECAIDAASKKKDEPFYEIELAVKGCRDVYASFDQYVQAKIFEGDNKYPSQYHGLLDATAGVRFMDFPPVLQLQLKRFDLYSGVHGYMRVNDRYEFPLELDLDREDRKYVSPENKVRNLYTLHSVLVHSGSIRDGHYYAFVRPTLSDQWFKLVDKWVTREDMKAAVEEQYGGKETTTSAYKLVYIRESDKEKILCNIDEKGIAEHLRIWLKKEEEAKEHKKKEKAEARFCTVKVTRNEDLFDQIGKEIHFDLINHDKVSGLRVEKLMPVHIFKKGVAKRFGVPVEFQRFWFWEKRINHTYRPLRPLTDEEETQHVGHLMVVSDEAHNEELKLFLEVQLGPDLRPIATPKKTKEDILLFFKFCDLENWKLWFVGWLFVNRNSKPEEILSRVNKLAGFSPNEEIELYEEEEFEPSVVCNHIDKKQTFEASKLQDGDIICFQKSLRHYKQDCCSDVPTLLESIHDTKVQEAMHVDQPKNLKQRRRNQRSKRHGTTKKSGGTGK